MARKNIFQALPAACYTTGIMTDEGFAGSCKVIYREQRGARILRDIVTQ